MSISALLRVWSLPLRICIAALGPRRTEAYWPTDAGGYAIEFYLSARYDRRGRVLLA